MAKAGLRTDVSKLTRTESIRGPQAGVESSVYKVWHNTDSSIGPEGKYLVDESGAAKWLVDPGINGVYTKRPDGSTVRKFEAPKATLMSYIIKGILDQQLPWALVLLGVMIAIILEMSGIPSLAFAVGVYLPLASSAPIFLGGLIRWLVDAYQKKQFAGESLTEDQLTAEGDKSAGVMLSSGYIAGGSIAGILIAFMGGVMTDLSTRLEDWAQAMNPFYSDAAWNQGRENLLSMIPFVVLVGYLYWVGRKGVAKVR